MSIKEYIAGTAGEFQLSQEERARAVRVVASAAADVDECREVLSMLGLDPQDGLPVPRPRRPEDDPTAQEPSASG